MKKYYFLAFSLCLSCTAIKQYRNQIIFPKEACAEMDFDTKVPSLDVMVEDVKTKFLFDTGATGSYLTDSTIIKNFDKKEIGRLRSGYAAGGKKFKRKQITVQIRSDVFDSDNKVLTYLKMPESDCSNKRGQYTGIVGLDVFFDKKLSMQLDFTNGKVCNISDVILQKLLKAENYQPVKSICKLNQVFIFLVVDGNEHRFKFDTGYSGNVLLKSVSDLQPVKIENKIELFGSLYQTAVSATEGKESFFQKIPVTVSSESVLSKVNVSSSVSEYIVGIEFIKGFDWIIDYNNNKIYAKRNDHVIESNFRRKVSYYAKVNKAKLKISAKEISQTKYNLGDEITSVNGEKVTAANRCEMQDLLNRTEDWNSLRLDVVPGQK